MPGLSESSRSLLLLFDILDPVNTFKSTAAASPGHSNLHMDQLMTGQLLIVSNTLEVVQKVHLPPKLLQLVGQVSEGVQPGKVKPQAILEFMCGGEKSDIWRQQGKYIIIQMAREQETPFLMGSILDGMTQLDDQKDKLKESIASIRSQTFSAPPAMTLYDYDELSKELFTQDDRDKDKPKKKLTKPVAQKPKPRQQNQQGFVPVSNYQFKYPETPQIPMQPMSQLYYGYPYMPMMYIPQEMDYSMYGYARKDRQFDAEQFIPMLNKMSRDRNGSRTVQNWIEGATDEEKQLIFQELMKDALSLIKDQFGNYVFQKIFEVGLNKHKKRTLELIKGRICDLSYNTFGCRVVQKALEYIRNTYEEQDIFINQLKGEIVNLVQDQNGNHVIQKCFECCASQKTECIVDQIIANIGKLAFHAYGCRVIQKFLENSKGDKLKLMLKRLLEMVVKLCKCQFGNYIMQYIVEHGPIQQKNAVLSTVKSNFVALSLDKFASNVVQKAIRNSNEFYRKELLQILQAPTQHNGLIGLVVLAQGQFSNYVVQRFLQYSDRQTQKHIMSLISENSSNYLAIKDSQYGRHVLSLLEKYR